MKIVCRTCLQVLTKGSISCPLELLVRSKLLVCVPELTHITDTNVPAVICGPCACALDTAYDFKIKCLQTEEKIMSYSQHSGRSADSVDMSDVVEFDPQRLGDAYIPITQLVEQDDAKTEAKPVDKGPAWLGYMLPSQEEVQTKLDRAEQNGSEKDVLDNGWVRSELDHWSAKIREKDDGNGSHVLAKYKCPHCSKSISNYLQLELHLLGHLDKSGKSWRCLFCQRMFGRKDKLVVHTRIHTGVKPYECELCGQSFSRKDKLTVHERVHTGERPYSCLFCKRGYTRRDKMKIHMSRCPQAERANLEVTVIKQSAEDP